MRSIAWQAIHQQLHCAMLMRRNAVSRATVVMLKSSTVQRSFATRHDMQCLQTTVRRQYATAWLAVVWCCCKGRRTGADDVWLLFGG